MGPPSGTFQLQNENPFRRAARRLAERCDLQSRRRLIIKNLPFLRTQSRLTADGRGGVRIDHGEYSDSTEGGDEDEVNASQQHLNVML